MLWLSTCRPTISISASLGHCRELSIAGARNGNISTSFQFSGNNERRTALNLPGAINV